MVRNGKMIVNCQNLSDMKQKKPSIGKSINETKNKWFDFVSDKFKGEDNSIFDQDWNSRSKNAEEIRIPIEIIQCQLAKCKNNSSPGVSGISWKLLKIMFKNDPDFITEVINDIINDRVEDFSAFAEMIVIPIFKSNKKGANAADCNSFRCLNLGEVL